MKETTRTEINQTYLRDHLTEIMRAAREDGAAFDVVRGDTAVPVAQILPPPTPPKKQAP